MAEFVTLRCPSCGGKLEIDKDVSRFACAHCGNEHVVIRKGGTVSLNPVEEKLGHIEKNTDLVSSELAIQRLDKEIATLEATYKDLISYPIFDYDDDVALHNLEIAALMRLGVLYKEAFKLGFLKKAPELKNWSTEELKTVHYHAEERIKKSNLSRDESGPSQEIWLAKELSQKLIEIKAAIAQKESQLLKHKEKLDH
jgi:hypothetical protein